MIRQLVQGIVKTGLPAVASHPAVPADDPALAAQAVLSADPLDLMLYVEQCWDAYSASAGPARRQRWASGRFSAITPPASAGPHTPGWDHLAASHAIENTRASQILLRVVREYRNGESLGHPSAATRHWLEATEALLPGTGAALTSALTAPAAAEATRRNAYWRLLGMDLAFGSEDNGPADYVKASAANAVFLSQFEALLRELWRAGNRPPASDDAATRDRIARMAAELHALLGARRMGGMLDRVELDAATMAGWLALSLGSSSAVIADLGARADTPAERLVRVGQRVGLAAHAKSEALLALAEPLSFLLRTLESMPTDSTSLDHEVVASLYRPHTPAGAAARRVASGWSQATGRDLTTPDATHVRPEPWRGRHNPGGSGRTR